MNKSESITALAKALTKFQAEVSNPKNTAINPHFKSKYAPLQDILTLVRPILSKHGLSVVQFPSGDGQNIVISTILMHESGEWLEAEPLTLKADKPTAQGAGSAITYGRRYTLAAILGISSEDDDDGNSASSGKKDSKSADKTAEPAEISQNSIKALHAIRNELGKTEDEFKSGISTLLKREIKSLKDLKENEAVALIKHLNRAKEEKQSA